MEKDIIDKLKELFGEEEIDNGITIVIEGTPIINVYLGSDE